MANYMVIFYHYRVDGYIQKVKHLEGERGYNFVRILSSFGMCRKKNNKNRKIFQASREQKFLGKLTFKLKAKNLFIIYPFQIFLSFFYVLRINERVIQYLESSFQNPFNVCLVKN